MDEDAIIKAERDYNAARIALAANKPNDNGSEGKYGVAYQKLVALGVRQQIKRKYR